MLRLLPIAGLLVLAALPAQARALCGQQFANRARLETSLKAMPGVRAFTPASGIMTMYGPKRTLWWFTVRPDQAYPAVVCVQQVERRGSYINLPVQSDCGNASKKTCRALARRLGNVKF
jgi:hypothetical protein